MIRSFSLRSRLAAASRRASAGEALARLVVRRAVVLRLARLLVEPARLDRLVLALRPLEDFALDDADRLEPVVRRLDPEREPREPPLLAWGITPPGEKALKNRVHPTFLRTISGLCLDSVSS